MKTNPKISVIIPNYNHAAFLKQRIESVLNQTFQDFEIIILDDSSTDNSKVIIEEYRGHPKLERIVYNDKNSGSTFLQWNKGVELATGQIIWIAESDDFAEKDFLIKMVPNFLKSENIGICFCQSYKLSDLNQVTGSWKSWTDDIDALTFSKSFIMEGSEFIEKYLIHKNVIPNASAVLFKKAAYLNVDGANPNVETCSDWLTWLKILTISDVSYEPQMLNYFRYHKNSVISKQIIEPRSVYLKKYQRILREEFNIFIKKNLYKTTSKKLYKINEKLLISETAEEAIFYLKYDYLPWGWKQLLVAAFSYEFRPLIFLKGLRARFGRVNKR